MRVRLRLLALAVCLVPLAPAATIAPAPAEGASPPQCAEVTTTATAPDGLPGTPPGGPCWSAVLPYPFGDEGEPVDTSHGARCAPGPPPREEPKQECFLMVTSMAFRAWNRGLAATSQVVSTQSNPYGVWIFNGTRWFPDPTFPGHGVCPGTTIVWAGKLDYWLVGGPERSAWTRLCRFDGVDFEWEPLEVPAATLARVTPPPTAEAPNPQPKPGAIKSAACFAWDSCWFFGTYGAVVHWDGHALIDASPDRSAGSLQAEITAAVAHRDPSGNPVGAAVAGTSEQFESAPLATQSDQAPPAELYGSSGGAFSPLPFTPFTAGQPQDPYRTDLVAVDLGPDGQGWVAGNPAGLRLHEREGLPPPVEKDQEPPLARQFSSPSPQPSPIQPVATTGVPTACTGPPSTRFTYTAVPKETKATAQEGAFLWSSLAVLPGAGEALAGGRMRRAPASAGKGNEDARIGEPVIAAAACDGTTTVTRFRIPDPLNPSQSAPADRGGSVTALAANASNDAWAATTTGRLESPDGIFFNGVPERPNVYRLTDGQPPASPEGNDEEFRPREEKLDAPIFVLEPPPPPEPPPSPAPVTQTHTETLPPAVYAVKVKVHATRRHGHLTLSLYLTFKVRRPTTIGAEALRRGRVVSVARPRHFTAGRGLLILNLDRRRWPTKVSFLA